MSRSFMVSSLWTLLLLTTGMVIGAMGGDIIDYLTSFIDIYRDGFGPV